MFFQLQKFKTHLPTIIKDTDTGLSSFESSSKHFIFKQDRKNFQSLKYKFQNGPFILQIC